MYCGLRGFARELGAALVRLAAYCGALAGIAYGVAHYVLQYLPVSAGVAAMPDAPLDWMEVGRPYPAFAVATGEFDGSETHYVIRRHPLGGRKDVITFGSAAGPGPHLLVEIYRAGPEQERFGDPIAEIATRVADLHPGALERAGAIETKFGRVALVDFATEQVGGPRQCLGFVRAFAEPAAQIAGIYCRAGPALIERGALACALDRLTLMHAGSDARIAGLFARAEVKRRFCGPHTAVLAATPKHGSWIDAAREPSLRGRLAGQ